MKDNYTPKQIVAELDKYIIGQKEAKKMVAIALRNRWRAKQLPEEVRDEYVPKNILLIGPTGVGKTELARRLAKIMHAPFVKVEATKYTEVGYVGRDVESMVRDLLLNSIRMVKEDKKAKNHVKATRLANQRLVDILLPSSGGGKKFTNPLEMLFNNNEEKSESKADIKPESKADERETLLKQISGGLLDDKEITIEVRDQQKNVAGIGAGTSQEDMANNIQDMLNAMMPKRMKKRTTTVKNARTIFAEEIAEDMLDMDEVHEEAIKLAEREGIIFIDEFDKIAAGNENVRGVVSREGVQRDILPIVEGSMVSTKFGPVNTEHILFIAAGAFHVSKPSDLIPELQGRFPIRVELNSLSKEDFKAILTTPQQALLKQYYMLLQADNVTIHFTDESIDKIAELAYRVNNETEDIGARRLHTILENLLQDVSYNAPAPEPVEVTITAAMVEDRLNTLVEDQDLSQYIL
ncbi:ATP-dependent protease ATPase subunit HslU [Veillonella rodentium]|uniref:ATP-dependent protease ATPase subunit ClpY n=1 Tax=Veillonella rodentium TaxID=248315 RepID=A0A239Z3D4_9FIRM|nr:ATP-dependent protease ATPase subunit HslU [Veillonella rodentium]SNV65562.1 ATP-dependent protease ATPase subunit ClpY [Veillonella rodentium]